VGLIKAALDCGTAYGSSIMHLIDVNPFVDNVFKENMASGKSPAFIPRQRAPIPLTMKATTQPNEVLGISAFAFQGTNAHAVVAGQTASSPKLLRGLTYQLWQRKCCWYTVLPHAIIRQFAWQPEWITFQVNMDSASCAYLRDHKVCCNSCWQQLIPQAN
jgi:hypothetical protein